MNIGMLVFPGITATDYVAPADLLVRMPGARLDLVWKHTDPITTELGWQFQATARFDDGVDYDMIVVPGGPGAVHLLEDREVLTFLAEQGRRAAWVVGVCTGPLVLGAAGLLEGYRATCHWASHELLSLVGAEPVDQRVVVDRNRVTGAGVTSGIDCALQVIALACGETVARSVQLFAEYDPQPPFEGGTPAKTPEAIVAKTREMVREVVEERRAILASAAHAQEARGPIRLLVGYPPGSPADTAARIVAERMGPELGQTVLVENRPGAGGLIAAQALKNAPADGSVLFVSNTHTIGMIPLTMKSPGFDPATDFRGLGTIATFELALAAHPKTGATDVQGLGRWLVERPGEASIGVPASTSAPEFLALRLSRDLGVNSVPIPYKGATPMVQDVLGGQVVAGVSGLSDFLQHHKAGRLRILAVSAPTEVLPEVPSFAQVGIPGLDLTDFLGLYGPAGLPAAEVDRLNGALMRVVALPEVQERFRAQAMTPVGDSAQAHAERLENMTKTLAAVVKESGFQPQ